MGRRKDMRDKAARDVPRQVHQGIEFNEEQQRLGQQAYDEGMLRQQAVFGDLQAAAQGRAPSLAQQQAAAGIQANAVNQMNMAAQSGGGNLAAQQRQISGMGAASQMATAQTTAQLRAQEMEAARAQMAAQSNAMAQAEQARMMAGNAGLQNMHNMQYGGDLAVAQGNQQNAQASLSQDLQRRQNNRNFGLGIVNTGVNLLGAVGGAAAMSDERVKTDIRPADDEAADAMMLLNPIAYKYKERKHGPTDRDIVGIKAQDLEKSKAGKSLIHETEDGKAVDMLGAVSLLLAHGASVERRLREKN